MDYKIFINYRRSDSEAYAGRLYDRLESAYSAERLFIDVDSIAVGDDFVARMKEKVREADVVLALIGSSWLEVKDDTGKRRLDDSNDPVRIELENALSAGKIVIPVLIGYAQIPRESALPDPLKPLARRNAERLSHETFAGDVKRLTVSVDEAVVAETERRQREAAAAKLRAEEERRRAEAEAARKAKEAEERALAEAAARAEADRKAREEAEIQRKRAEERERLLKEAEQARKRAAEIAAQLTAEGVKLDAPQFAGLGDTVSKAEELARWDFVKPRGRLDELRAHLQRYPNGVTADMARAALEPLEWATLAQSSDEVAVSKFLADFPKSEHAGAATSRLDMLRKQRIEREIEARVNDAIAKAQLWRQRGETASRDEAIAGLAAMSSEVRKAGIGGVETLASKLESAAFCLPSGHSEQDDLVGFLAAFPDGSLKKRAAKRLAALDKAEKRSQAASVQTTDRVTPRLLRLPISRRKLLVGTGALVAGGGAVAAGVAAGPDALSGLGSIWQTLFSNQIVRIVGHSGSVGQAVFSPDGIVIATASNDNTARLWDASTGQPLGEPMKHENTVNSAAFSPDGRRVVTASNDDTARLWDAATGQPLGEPMKHGYTVNSAAFSPGGTRVVTASKDDTARLWDAATGLPIGEPMAHEGEVGSAAFSPDGTRVVTASRDNTARLWDAATGQPLGEPMKHADWVRSAAFSPDGTRVVTASWDNTARLWDAATGQPLSEPMKHENMVSSADFSPDGTRVVTASRDGTARLWDTATGQPIGEPMHHDSYVNSAAFSPDGTRVVTASDDNTARLWDEGTGQPLGEPMKHEGDVYSATFSPDGRFVLTASTDRTARIWAI